MGKASIGPRLQVDGEEEYRAQIKQIIEQAKTLDAQMSAVTASFNKNTTAEEKAAKTSGILAQQIATAEKRVNLLRDMVEKSTQATGDNSQETLKWKQALYGAEEQLGKLRAQEEEVNETLEDTGEAMEESAKKGESLGDQVDSIASKLGINLPESAKKALDGMKSMSAGSVVALSAIAAGAVAAVKAIQKLNEITTEAATRADDLLTQSVVSGISTDMLQQIQYAAPYIDVSAETMTGALTKITKSIGTARDQFAAYNEAVKKSSEQGKAYEGELGSAAAAFNKLGVSVTDGNEQLRAADAVMVEALQALSGIGNETERDTIAMALFGKSAQELNPLILNLDNAQRLYNEAIAEGYVLSEDQLAILGEVDDANQKYSQTIEKNKNLIAVQWAPANKEAYETLAKLTETAGKALINSKLIENGATLVSSGLMLVQTVTDIVGAGADLMNSLPTWINPIKQVSEAFKALAILIAGVVDTINLISGIMPQNWGSGKARDALGLNARLGRFSNIQRVTGEAAEWEEWRNSTMSAGKATGVLAVDDQGRAFDMETGWYVDYMSPIRRHNAAGTEYWQGGGTWVGEAGAEYVQLPRGSRIYSNQESRQLMGGDTIYNISVQNVQELDEIIDWYESRRIRGRMG